MGSGYKDFSPGDVLTAADVDGYLMRQTVMTFADASARDTALSGVLDEGMVAYLEDVNAVTVYNGSAWVAVIDSDVLTVDTANNRVGIGTATPSQPLHVYSSTGDVPVLVESGDSTVNLSLADSSTTTPANQGVRVVGNDLFLATSNTRRLTVTSSGDVGINDIAPSYTLDVNGDINATGNLRIAGNAIGTYTDYSSSVLFGGFTKGTSTVVAKYARVGKFVHYWGYVVLASGSSMTGPLDVSLPIGEAGPILSSNSPCSFYDGGSLYWGTAIHLGGGSIRLVAHAAGGTYAFNADVAFNVPFTWATGDVFYWNHFYEAA